MKTFNTICVVSRVCDIFDNIERIADSVVERRNAIIESLPEAQKSQVRKALNYGWSMSTLNPKTLDIILRHGKKTMVISTSGKFSVN